MSSLSFDSLYLRMTHIKNIVICRMRIKFHNHKYTHIRDWHFDCEMRFSEPEFSVNSIIIPNFCLFYILIFAIWAQHPLNYSSFQFICLPLFHLIKSHRELATYSINSANFLNVFQQKKSSFLLKIVNNFNYIHLSK